MAGTSGAVGIASIAAPGMAGAAEAAPRRKLSGRNLDGWETVVGDGVFAATGQRAVNGTDIGADHFSRYSKLSANSNERGVMAHNITYHRVIDGAALLMMHDASFEFRIPFVPSTSGGAHNAQTFEGGLFIWDGRNDRLDYGLAFQWVLNPWAPEFGAIRAWTPTPDGPAWSQISRLEPDDSWHSVWFGYDHATGSTGLAIDGRMMPVSLTETSKADSWGTDIEARLQAEIISIYPGEADNAPSHVAEVRDWSWDWTPNARKKT